MLVELEGLTKAYGRKRALDRVSASFSPGKVVAVVGLNGAGKSTLLHAIAGLLYLRHGVVRFDGEVVTRDRVDLRRRMAFLPDFPLFFEEMTVLEHLSMVLRFYERDGEGSTERVLELLKAFSIVGLARHPLAALSRGELYKAALCGVIAAGPSLWLLDEPMASGMDGLGLKAFRHYAREAVAAGTTILYTTQILTVAETFCDEVVILDHGRLHAHGPLEAIRREGDLEVILETLSEG